MVNQFIIYVLPPTIAFVVSIIAFFLILSSFNSKPWSLKAWLITSVFFWIPWSGFTILMRYADNAEMARLYLRMSFISLQILVYGLYRFHHLMVFKPTDNRVATFGLAIITGFNIALSFNPTYLDVVYTSGYYTDQFHPLLMITNIYGGIWSMYWVFQSLNAMDAMAIFYDDKGNKTTFPIIFLLGLMVGTLATFAIWLISGAQTDSTPFILVVTLGFTFIGFIYGINPNSTILAPQRLWGFIIIDRSGLPVFEHHFSKDKRIGELSLLAMAITASNTVLVANLQSGSYVNEVVLEDRAVLIAQKNDLLFCLFADHPSLQLQIVLNEAVKRITESELFIQPKIRHQLGKFIYVNEIIEDIFQTNSLQKRVRERMYKK